MSADKELTDPAYTSASHQSHGWRCDARRFLGAGKDYSTSENTRLAGVSSRLLLRCVPMLSCPRLFCQRAEVHEVANARDQSRFISERWDDVSPPSPSVHSRKLGAKQNEEGMKASVVFEMKHSGNLY